MEVEAGAVGSGLDATMALRSELAALQYKRDRLAAEVLFFVGILCGGFLIFVIF